MASYSFEQRDFPSLTLYGWEMTWTDVPLSFLQSNEQEGLRKLLKAIAIPHPEDPLVLLVKADKTVLKGIYGCSFFRQGDDIVLKVGEVVAIASQEKGKIQVGSLTGKISVTIEIDAKGDSYPVAGCVLVDEEDNVFTVRVALAQNIDSAALQAALLKDKPLTKFIAPVPSTTLKMQDLGLGEYEVTSISEQDSPLGGTSFRLHLADGRSVWARGNSAMLLDSGWEKPDNQPLTLIISNIEQMSDGKYKVDNALRLCLPRVGALKPAQLVLDDEPQTDLF